MNVPGCKGGKPNTKGMIIKQYFPALYAEISFKQGLKWPECADVNWEKPDLITYKCIPYDICVRAFV